MRQREVTEAFVASPPRPKQRFQAGGVDELADLAIDDNVDDVALIQRVLHRGAEADHLSAVQVMLQAEYADVVKILGLHVQPALSRSCTSG